MVFNLIVFLGPPGSGKGTQAKLLSDQHGFAHLSTGDLLREAIQAGTPLGLKVKGVVDGGQLVPDELVSALIFEKLDSLPKSRPVILDGYPRTVEQAKSLDAYGQKSGRTVDGVLFFDVKPTDLVNRLSQRRQCPSCKEVYNLATKPPKQANVCDKCGAVLIQRKDDQKDVIEERLRVYAQQTQPILNFYGKHAGFRELNAAEKMETVYAAVRENLNLTSKA